INLKTYGMWVGNVAEGEETFQRISVPGASHTGEVGKPMLPVFSRSVAIPPTAGVKVKVEYKEEIVLKDYNVYPAQPPLMDNQEKKEFQIEDEFYEQDTIYPVEYYYVGTPGIMRDVRLVGFAIKPFRYNPKTKELTVATDITVRLDYSGYDGRNALEGKRLKSSHNWKRMCRAKILNYDDLYGNGRIGTMIEPPLSAQDPPHYLIICAEEFMNRSSLSEFKYWKKKQGFNVYVRSLRDIVDGMPDAYDDVNDVKRYIKAVCLTYPETENVLLIGDAPDYGSPPNYDFVKCSDDSHIPTFAYPEDNPNYSSDYWYSLLTGDWEDPDPYPDICLGRWCVSSNEDLEAYVEKTLDYERDVNSNWDCEDILLVAHKEEWMWYQYRLCKEYIQWENCYGMADTLYGKHDWATNALISDAISSDGGLGLINYRGHGSETSWYRWNTRDQCYTATDVHNLDQTSFQGYPVVYNIACDNGIICWDSECMVEAWTRDENGGAVGALAASTGTWTEGNNHLDSTLFRNHFDDVLNCGLAINAAKVETINRWIEYPSDSGSWALEIAQAYHWIGDPSLDVWRIHPYLAYDSLDFGTQIEVKVMAMEAPLAPVAGTRVCLYHEYGEHHKVAYTDEYGKAYFPYPDPKEDGTYYVTSTNQWHRLYNIVPVCTTFYYSGTFGQQGESIIDVIEWNLKSITPNLVSSNAKVSYSVGGKIDSKTGETLKLSVFDITGREVSVLASGEHRPGHYTATWDGKDNYGVKLASGVYFIRMVSPSFTSNERIILLK
ncbi:hypothetical protein GF359_03565, partial [candidate division WOR-3 bacterium]|nr:hypothetical protein [candidate division WOR-3 bacterium]MBD3364273.1 hypothetical protein [candidate division WOR-3 bacterium]